MSTFDQLSEKLSSVENGDTGIMDFYTMLWKSGMLLEGEQFNNIILRLKKTGGGSTRMKCCQLLSEGILATFFTGFGNAFEILSEARESFIEIDDRPGEGAAQALLSIYFKNIGQLDKAQECVQNSILNLGEDKTYMHFLCISYYQAGEIHHLLKDYDSAIKFFTTGLKYTNDNNTLGTRMLNGLGTVYRDTGEFDKAFELFQQALKRIEGADNHIIEAKIYADIGSYYFLKNDFGQSLSFHDKSIQIRKKHNLNSALVTNYLELAELYIKQNKLPEALANALLSEKLSKELNIVIKIYQAYLIVSTIYEAMNETSLALDYYKKYHKLKDEVFSQESARKIKQLSMHHEMETMQKEKELFKLKNVVLKEALDEIEASVRYAQHIQEAILPPIEMIKAKLPDTFVLYKPKDVVAGDFYWLEEMGDMVLIAAADCTGHGVPGAMVSVVCSNALNRAVKEFKLSSTGAILDKVTDLVMEAFEKSIAEVKDGMDISILSINKKTKELQWSGANNPLLYSDNGELKEITADKQPIGKSDYRKPFTTHTITYKPGTLFYLFTDGYADQFGGPKGKKFLFKHFKEILSSFMDKELNTQQEILDETFRNWKGELMQVDDVCVIGIRI